MVKCLKCSGSGIIYYNYQDGDHEHTLDDVCDACNGTGEIEPKIPDFRKPLNASEGSD